MKLAVLAAAAGVLGFTFLTDQPTLARVGVLIGGLAVALVVAWFSQPGKRFIGNNDFTTIMRCKKHVSPILVTG